MPVGELGLEDGLVRGMVGSSFEDSEVVLGNPGTGLLRISIIFIFYSSVQRRQVPGVNFDTMSDSKVYEFEKLYSELLSSYETDPVKDCKGNAISFVVNKGEEDILTREKWWVKSYITVKVQN